MSGRDIKERLDDAPRDFDREALWNSIDKPESKKRRGIFWLFFAGLFVVTAFVGIKYDLLGDSNSDPVIAQAVALDSADINVTDNVSTVMELPTNVDSKVSSTDESRFFDHRTITPNGESATFLEQKNTALEVPQQSYVSKRNGLFVATTEVQNAFEVIPKTDSPIGMYVDQEATNSLQDVLAKKPTRSLQQARPLILVPNLLQDFNFGGLGKELMPLDELPFVVSKPKANAQNRWFVSFGSTIGRQEVGSQSMQIPFYTEKALETIGLGVTVGHHFHNLSLFTKINYVTSNSQMNYSTEEVKYIGAVANPTVETTYSTYKYYNNQQRLDAQVGLAYNYYLGRVVLRPSLALGADIWTRADGHSFDAELLFTPFSPDYTTGLGLFVAGELEASYLMSNRAQVGVFANIESARSYNPQYKIKPLHVGIRMRWNW